MKNIILSIIVAMLIFIPIAFLSSEGFNKYSAEVKAQDIGQYGENYMICKSVNKGFTRCENREVVCYTFSSTLSCIKNN